MAKGRSAKPYVEGPRKQMTVAWKKLVLEKLAANKIAKLRPANLSQLSTDTHADKRGIYQTFNLEIDPPQMSSAYVDEICRVLGIGPPMLESSHDPELERDLDVFRALSPARRKAFLALMLTDK